MKKRADILLVEKNYTDSRTKAQSLIMSGNVYINGSNQIKPGSLYPEEAEIIVKEKIPFSSRGGVKLQKALEVFNPDLENKIAFDIGASTGGFTSCLLLNKVAKVFAIDVGHGQLDYQLTKDPRVVNIEKTNVRFLKFEDLNLFADIIVIDVSFISLKLIIPPLLCFLKKDSSIIALIKPQFEVGKRDVGKGGIVRDMEKINQTIEELKTFFINSGLSVCGLIPSPITGAKGNQEYLIFLKLSIIE